VLGVAGERFVRRAAAPARPLPPAPRRAAAVAVGVCWGAEAGLLQAPAREGVGKKEGRDGGRGERGREGARASGRERREFKGWVFCAVGSRQRSRRPLCASAGCLLPSPAPPVHFSHARPFSFAASLSLSGNQSPQPPRSIIPPSLSPQSSPLPVPHLHTTTGRRPRIPRHSDGPITHASAPPPSCAAGSRLRRQWGLAQRTKLVPSSSRSAAAPYHSHTLPPSRGVGVGHEGVVTRNCTTRRAIHA
jgi:hypothetical protein